MNSILSHEKEELIRVIFMPISNRLQEETGSSLVEVEEHGHLFVSFITALGNIRVRCSGKRFIIQEFNLELRDTTMDYFLLRLCLFLRRNEGNIISILRDPRTATLVDFVESRYPDSMFTSLGEETYLELKVSRFIARIAERAQVNQS